MTFSHLLPSKTPSLPQPIRVLDITRYDRFQGLYPHEYAELHRLVSEEKTQIRQRSKALLCRLLQPAQDVLRLIHISEVTSGSTYRVLCREMYRRETAFWSWSEDEWKETLCVDQVTFVARYGWHLSNAYAVCARSYLPALAYFLCPHLNMKPLLDFVEIYTFAMKIFGEEAITSAVQRIVGTLESWGYRQKTNEKNITACICYFLLVNRSPHVEDICYEQLHEAQTATIYSVRRNVWKVSRALFALGVTAKDLQDSRQTEGGEARETDKRINEEWLTWCQRWRKQNTLQTARGMYYSLLKVGRWLQTHHPEITNPAQWTYELAAEFVAAVSDMKNGDWSATTHVRGQVGTPLRPIESN